MADRLFVYGTLMPGGPNYGHIEYLVRSHRPGTIRGTLVDLGAYPALIAGNGVVKGIVLETDAEVLAITDRIEGYQPDRDHCLYLRREVVVRLEDEQETIAWAYFFADAANIAGCPRLVVDEDQGKPVFAWPSDPRR